MKKVTQDKILEKIRSIHGDKYSFSKFNYISYKEMVCLICEHHGDFKISLSNLIGNKRGCPECGRIRSKNSGRSNNSDFISKANNIHNFKYQYDHVVYYNCSKNVIITCPIHGTFSKSPNSHLNGSGCPSCNIDNKKKLKDEENNRIREEIKLKKLNSFIENSIIVHGNRYDYSSVEYISSNKKVKIYCEKHGYFEQKPSHHKRGNGCPICSYEDSFGPRISTSDFITISKNKHNNYYSYEKSKYLNSKEKIIITCPIHGDFKQEPKYHMKGGGCLKCNVGRGNGNLNLKYNTEQFIEICNNLHNNKYDYSETIFKGVKRKVTIVCPIHGGFEILAYNHMNGTECSKCSIDKKKRNKIDLISELNLIHNSKYTYIINDEFISTLDKINIICPNHGKFEQNVDSHLRGSGCYLCKTKSRGEIFIKNVLEKWKINYKREKSFNNRLRFDFWIQELNTIIEFDGRHHFQPIKYFGGQSSFEKIKINDQLKNEYCKENNINLLRISYKDLKRIEEIIKKEIIDNAKLKT